MKIIKTLLAVTALSAFAMPADAGLDPYVGEIFQGGWNFCPRGSIPLDGQLLPISQNTALFSLLGTTYGGDGRTTFGVPDMRGRSPMHEGQGPGLTNRPLGESGGKEKINLSPLSHLEGGMGNNKIIARADGNSGRKKNLHPYAVIQYCMATVGVFPSRN
jgi:microcystin-dependent protein